MPTLSPIAQAFAKELGQRYRDASVIDWGAGETGQLQHDVLAEGAKDAFFEPNTGGWVWVSHVLFEAPDGTLLHMASTTDGYSLYFALAASAEACATALGERCGETADIDVGSADFSFPEAPAEREAVLHDMYGRFLKRHDLPEVSCEDLLVGYDLTPAQRQWASAFVRVWEENVA